VFGWIRFYFIESVSLHQSRAGDTALMTPIIRQQGYRSNVSFLKNVNPVKANTKQAAQLRGMEIKQPNNTLRTYA